MGGHDLNSQNNTEFDTLLQNTLSSQPPDEIIRGVTPWRKAFHRILTGFALGAITLNFWGLNYLLPTIGLCLVFLGFRTLRTENRWFHVCWVLTVIRMVCYFPVLVVNTTIYQTTFHASAFGSILSTLNAGIGFYLYFCLWKALRCVQEKAGLVPRAGGAAALLIWSAVVFLLAVLQVPDGLLPGVLLLVAYFFILRSLVMLSRELDEAGYCIIAAPVRFPDKIIVLALTLVTLLSCGCGYLFFHQYPMSWQPVSQSTNPEVQQIRDHLLSLGFPEHILEDLAEEEILACKGALAVVTDVCDHSVNTGHEVQEQIGNTIHIYTEYPEKELRITGVGVALPGEKTQWKLFHHFQWLSAPHFWGTDVIQLWPAYNNGKGWLPAGDVTGRILCDDGKQVFSAPYYELGSETYTSNTIFWGEQTSTDLFASFSMPKDKQNYRGYVSYAVTPAQEGWLVDAWINYTHQISWLQFPAITAKEKHLITGVSDTHAFITVQDALQFSPLETRSN